MFIPILKRGYREQLYVFNGDYEVRDVLLLSET